MKDWEFQNKLKQLFDILGNKTVADMNKNDTHYQAYDEADEKAEIKYLEIRESLTEEQQKVIDKFIDCRTALDNEYSVNCYFAGMKDMYRILAYLKIL